MKIYIENLHFECIVGILDFERVKEQKVIINFECEYDYVKGAFVDYATIAQTIKSLMQEGKYELLEEAILDITNSLKTQFAIYNIYLKITKPNILDNMEVSISN